MTSNTFLLYGAYGYTGRLIAEQAVQRGLRPLLAGRDSLRLERLARQLNLEYRAFSLEDSAELEKALAGQPLILHCAGPFHRTYRQVADACLRTGRHYLDITGEIAVFEGLAAMDSAARQAGVMLLPGVGFDVVPSDCLAAHLKSRLPTAEQLVLAIRNAGSGFSQGTALTMLEGYRLPGAVRRNGRLENAVTGAQQRSFDFGRGPRMAVSIPWGDISTAYFSTGIPNIDTFMAFPPAVQRIVRLSGAFKGALGTGLAQTLLRRLVKAGPAGPTAEQRRTGRSFLYAEVQDPQGKKAAARLETLEGYALTILSSLLVVEKILRGQYSPGFQTPSKAYGPGLVLELPETHLVDLD